MDPESEVAVLRWPEQRHEIGDLERRGIPRLLLVSAHGASRLPKRIAPLGLTISCIRNVGYMLHLDKGRLYRSSADAAPGGAAAGELAS